MKPPSNSSFDTAQELKEIKKRVTEAEVSKALSGHATQGGGSLGRAIEGHSGIGYTTDKAKTIPNAFKYPDVNIDMTFGFNPDSECWASAKEDIQKFDIDYNFDSVDELFIREPQNLGIMFWE